MDKACDRRFKSEIFDKFNFNKNLIKHNLNKVAVKYKNKTILIDLRRDEFDKYSATKYAKLYFGRFITIKYKKEYFEFDILI